MHETAAAQASWRARQVLQGAQADLHLRLMAVQGRAAEAASLNQVRALVTDPLDRATVNNAFRDAPWWRPFREEFPVQALFVDHERFDYPVSQSARLPLEQLIAPARRKAPAFQLLVVEGHPYAAAAAAVDVPKGEPDLVLALAKPLDRSDLFAISRRLGGALLLVYHRSVVMGAGSPEEQNELGSLVGREESETVVDPTLKWAAAAGELGRGLFLWAYSDATGIAERTRWSLAATLVPIWGGTILIALGFLWLGLRRG